MNVTYANCTETHYAILRTCPARKQAINLVWSRRNELRTREQERKQRREEQEATEKAKRAESRIQVAATAQQNEKREAARTATWDLEDGDLRMRDSS